MKTLFGLAAEVQTFLAGQRWKLAFIARLEWKYIDRNLTPLCAATQAPEILDKLRELKRRIVPSE